MTYATPVARPDRKGTFAALRVPNYRLFFGGQAVSLSGTWMQTIAQGWLVLRLGGSGTQLGLITAAQFLPVLLLGAYGGLIADRADKRKLLIATQCASALCAGTLAVLDLTGVVTLWMVALVAACLGIVNAADNPARQSFVHEMVGPDHLSNAVTLNSVLVNAARAVGPGIAGALITLFGTGPCFAVNCASFLAVIVALARMDSTALRVRPPVVRAKRQVRDGLTYVARTPQLKVPLLMMALVGALSYEFQVVLPLVARETFHGGAGTYSVLTSAMGVGAVTGGLLVARHGAASISGTTGVARAAIGFGAVIGLAAAAPILPLEIVALLLVGAGSVAFLATGNSTLQLVSAPQMRGRVMSLWAIAFLGSTPVGGPIAGWVSTAVGARAGLAMGAAAAILAGIYGLVSARRLALRESAERDLGRADLARADLVPADLVPADLVPADLVPADLVPADLVPAD
ncbi:MAG: MFS transporter, partial [Frankia sp.]